MPLRGAEKRGQASPDDGDALALTFAQLVAPAEVEEKDEEEGFAVNESSPARKFERFVAGVARAGGIANWRLAAPCAAACGSGGREAVQSRRPRQLYARFVNSASRNMSGCWTKGLFPPGFDFG